MKKLSFFFFFLLFINMGLKAQGNLAPNFSFEQYSSCPDFSDQIYLATPWFQPTQGTSDYFNSCTSSGSYVGVPNNILGYQAAKTGVAYAGLITYLPGNYREYIEAKMNAPLIAGQKYFVSFYVSLADSIRYATDGIGLYFSNDTLKNETEYLLSVTPQIRNPEGNIIIDRTSWTKISGTYIAAGGEKFITIGNFKDDAHTDTVRAPGGSASNGGLYDYTAYYYIDDVCISTDSLLCNNVLPVTLLSFNAVSQKDFIRLIWRTAQESKNKGFDILRSEGNANHFEKIGFITGAVNSSIETQYVFNDKNVQKGIEYFYQLRQIDFDNKIKYSAIERGRISGNGNINFTISPNPVANKLTLYFSSLSKENFTVMITDAAGKTLFSQLYNATGNPTVNINMQHFASGLYFITLIQNNNTATQKIIKQ